METCLAIFSDAFWFTPALLVMFAMTVLLAGVILRRSPAPVEGAFPPGTADSLRPKLERINASLLLRLLFTMGVAVTTGITARAVAEANNLPLVDAVMFAGSGIAMGLMLWTWKLLTPWRTAQEKMGFEREVGRDLNLLMLDGCRVFHHLTHKTVGDIDHIIVAPHAVYMVETYSDQRPASTAGGKVDAVVFDGKELLFPKHHTEGPVKIAAAKARWLSKHLEHRTGISLPVHPIVALPGWLVQQTAEGEVAVTNPRDIATRVIDKAAEPLYDAQRRRIINFLDSNCQYAPF